MQRSSEQILDEYLVIAAQGGDRLAWQRLVVRWQPRLWRHAWRVLGHPERAADVVQDAWMQIMRGLIRLQDARAFPCWAFRIVTRRCQLQFKRADRERQTGEALLAEQTLAPTDSNAGEQSVDLAQVGRALSCLPASQRAAMALFYIENLSVAEIAVALDVPPGTVKTRLMHARQKIRAALEGAEHEPD